MGGTSFYLKKPHKNTTVTVSCLLWHPGVRSIDKGSSREKSLQEPLCVVLSWHLEGHALPARQNCGERLRKMPLVTSHWGYAYSTYTTIMLSKELDSVDSSNDLPLVPSLKFLMKKRGTQSPYHLEPSHSSQLSPPTTL